MFIGPSVKCARLNECFCRDPAAYAFDHGESAVYIPSLRCEYKCFFIGGTHCGEEPFANAPLLVCAISLRKYQALA